jgi:hypothetical protein
VSCFLCHCGASFLTFGKPSPGSMQEPAKRFFPGYAL